MPAYDWLSAELEKLYLVEDLARIRVDLGLDAVSVPDPDRGAGAYARALVEACEEHAALAALADVISAHPSASDRARGLAASNPDAAPAPAGPVGPFRLDRLLGEGPVGRVYYARDDADRRFRVKVLRDEVAALKSARTRWSAAARRAGRIRAAGLPRAVQASIGVGPSWVAHEFVDGLPLYAHLSQTGAQRLRDAWSLIRALLEALSSLHAGGVVHGALSASNVLVTAGGEGGPGAVLLDVGSSHLAAPGCAAVRFADVAAAESAPPEQLRGDPPTTASDLYSFGAILYRIVAGRPPFGGQTASDLGVAHLARDVEPLSFAAPRGWIADELDEFVLQLLERDPGNRPADAHAALDLLDTLVKMSVRRDSLFPDAEFDSRVARLLENPADEVAAGVLESGVDQGADPTRVAEAFRLAAEQLGDDRAEARGKLLARAGALYEGHGDLEEAERTYRALLEADPNDPANRAALERILSRAKKHEALVEMLLQRADSARPGEERATVLAHLGRVMAEQIGDREQAVVALTQAFCERPTDARHRAELERVAGSDRQLWVGILGSAADAVATARDSEHRSGLLLALGQWNREHGGRPDVALQCFQSVLFEDPANEVALRGAIDLYRTARQWTELGAALSMLADGAVSQGEARDLRAEAGKIYEANLGDRDRAAACFERVLIDDPAHPSASEGLARLRDAEGDHRAWVAINRRRAEALTGEERHGLLCRVARRQNDVIGDVHGAIATYREVVKEAPGFIEALVGLERAYSALGKVHELLENLEQQLEHAVTPSQKVALWERIAALQADELKNPALAVQALETLLDIDPTNDAAMRGLERHYRNLARWEDLAALYEKRARLRSGEHRIEDLLALGRVAEKNLGQADRALASYESVFDSDPDNEAALDALARLRTGSGDQGLALEAIDALARHAKTPQEKATQLVRAASLLRQRGNLEAAIARYKSALEAAPGNDDARAGLVEALLAEGDADGALQILQRQLESAESDFSRARACARMARAHFEHTKKVAKAQAAAERALDYDPTSVEALRVVASLEYEAGRFAEAARFYERLSKHDEASSDDPAFVDRFTHSLAKGGRAREAMELARRVSEGLPGDLRAADRAARLVFEHAEPAQALASTRGFVERFRAELAPPALAEAYYRFGESARRAGELVTAVIPLQRAADLDATATKPLAALAGVYAARKQWAEHEKTLHRQLERVTGADRAAILVELGDAAASRKSSDDAARYYLEAHAEHPDERKILLKLMRLYSAERDWQKLVEVLVEAARTVDDSSQKAKFLQTAARVALDEMQDRDRATELLDEAIESSPSDADVARDAIELYRSMDALEAVERVLEQQIRIAVDTVDHDRAIAFLRELADLHLSQLKTDEAIRAYEIARELDPANREYAALLADLYASDPVRYFDRAVESQEARIVADPYAPEPFKALRDVYLKARRPDAVWCVAQVLTLLHRAAPEDEALFKRYRSESPRRVASSLTSDDYDRLVSHPTVDPLVTQVFRVIEPIVLAARARPLDAASASSKARIRPDEHPHGAVLAFERAAELFGVEVPPLFHAPDSERGVAFITANPMAIALGSAALNAKVPAKPTSFVAGAHLVYLRRGHAMRLLAKKPAGLKVWLLAALRLVAPTLPVGGGLAGQVEECREILASGVRGALKDELAEPVSKLLERGARVDVGGWIAGVDLTTDRAGLIASDDLGVCLSLIKRAGDGASSVPAATRFREIMAYAASRAYVDVRARVGIDIDWSRASTRQDAAGGHPGRPPPKPGHD